MNMLQTDERRGLHFSEIIERMDGDIAKALREVFDGHESPDDALEYWDDMPGEGFTPHGCAVGLTTIEEAMPVQRLAEALQAMFGCNAWNVDDPDTRSGAVLIDCERLRAVHRAFNGETR